MLATGIGVVKSGILPKWLGWVAVAIGIVAATPAGFVAAIAAALWILVSSMMLADAGGGRAGRNRARGLAERGVRHQAAPRVAAAWRSRDAAGARMRCV